MYREFWWGTLSVNVLYILKTEQGWKGYPEIHIEEGSDEWKGLEQAQDCG
jgi:hypothetical protein